MTMNIILPFHPMSRSDYRLACGLVLSLLAHLLLVAAVRPMTAVYPPRPLLVEIRQTVTTPDAPLSLPAYPGTVADTDALLTAREPVKHESMRPDPGAIPERRPDPRLPLERYFTSLEVDVRAQPLNDPPLFYPQQAYQMRLRGKVTLRILISEQGGVDGVTVLESEPRGLFEEAALDAARSLQYSPAIRYGHRVKSQKVVEVDFDPYQNIHVP